MDDAVQAMVACGKTIAGEIPECEIDNHEDLVNAGADAMKTHFDNMCGARQQGTTISLIDWLIGCKID